MKRNMGAVDRWIRGLVALIIIALYIGNVISGTLGIVLLVIAGVLIITSVIGFCPLYYPFGVSTNRDIQKGVTM